MFSNGNWLGAFKPRRSSRGSISSSSSGSFSSAGSSSSKTSRSGSLSSLFSRRASVEEPEWERLMVDEPVKRTPYVPRYAARSFMKTTTTHEIRVNSEVL